MTKPKKSGNNNMDYPNNYEQCATYKLSAFSKIDIKVQVCSSFREYMSVTGLDNQEKKIPE